MQQTAAELGYCCCWLAVGKRETGACMCRSVCAYMSPLFPVPSLSLAAQRQADLDLPHKNLLRLKQESAKRCAYIHDPYSIKHISLEAGEIGPPQIDFQGMRKRGIKRELRSLVEMLVQSGIPSETNGVQL